MLARFGSLVSRLSHSPRAVCAAAALAAALLAAPSAAFADQTHLNVAAYGLTEEFNLELNKSIIVDLPGDVAEVIVSQPAVAGTVMRTTRRAIIQGVSAGATNIFFLDNAGRTISVLDVEVTEAPSQVGGALQSALARILPGSNIRVDSVALDGGTSRVVLSGSVLSSEDADQAVLIAAQYAGGPENVASVIDVAGAQQVMLQVTVSEVRREIAKQLGINLSGTLTVGTASFGFNNTMTGTSFTGNGGSADLGFPSLQINAAIRALEENGALRILAQPTLTALSGESANFLAGGELPYYTRDDNGEQTVIFKPYGVELEFTPVVTSNGKIGLTIDTSVSDPQPDGSLTKRQASTSVELPQGTTIAIGGLLEERVRQQINRLPGLGNIPILGALFRSREFQTLQTELVILVTPYLVQPSHHIPVPTDDTYVASDAEAIFLGHMEKTYGVGHGEGMRGTYAGSVGFVLD